MPLRSAEEPKPGSSVRRALFRSFGGRGNTRATGRGMNVLITGAAGVLGAHLVARLSGDHRVRGTDRHAWWGDETVHFMQGDLANDAVMSNVIGHCAPDVLIHCAGMVDVDACERHPQQAFMANAEIARRLVSRAPATCLFVYTSTDSVFSENRHSGRKVTNPVPSTSMHGRSSGENTRRRKPGGT
jgi:dTDP-4-dehydrorhamnose reductase